MLLKLIRRKREGKILFNPVNIICFILLSLSMQIYMDIFFEKRHWHLILVNPVIACMTYIILIIFPNVNPWGNIAIVIIFFSIYGMFIYQGMRCLCEYIVLFILSLSYAQEVIFKKEYYDFARTVSHCLLVFLTLCISRIVSYKKSHGVKSQSSVILLLLATATVIVDWGVYQIYLYPKSTSADYYAILIASIMMAMSIVIIKIYEGLGEKAELETRNTIYQRQVEAYRVQSSERGNAKRISSSET